MEINVNKRILPTIIIGKNSSMAERHAANELAGYLYKICKAKIPVCSEDCIEYNDFKNFILIGRFSTNTLLKEEILNGNIPNIENIDGNDEFIIKCYKNKLVLSGSRDRSTIYSVYHLLEEYLNVGFFWDGEKIPESDYLFLPEIYIREKSPFRYRHITNAGIYNFGIFWTFKERKWELDLLAKNKINSYLINTGMDYVKKITYQKMNVPVEPINERDIARMEITRQTCEYARMLDIELMTYFPMLEVSHEFKLTYPDARYFGSEWVRDDTAEAKPLPFLYPEDPLFLKLVETYITTWKETYGECHNFSACPPSEHRIFCSEEEFENINIMFSKFSLQALKAADPGAKLFFDGWGVRANTPPHIWSKKGVIERFIENMPEEDVYFLDLWPNRKDKIFNFREPFYRDEKFYPIGKRKFILEVLNEFGGDDHLHGDFDRVIEIAKELVTSKRAENCVGFGNTTEVRGFSVHFFDLIFKLAWNPLNITVEKYISKLVFRRYGEEFNQKTEKALIDLREGVYSDFDTSHARYQKRIFLTKTFRPVTPPNTALKIIGKITAYLNEMITLPENFIIENKLALNDIYDSFRQYISELFNLHLQMSLEIFKNRNSENIYTCKEEFEKHARIMDFLLEKLEEVVYNNKDWHMEEIVKRYYGLYCDEDLSHCFNLVEDFRKWMRDAGTTFACMVPNLIDYPSKDYFELIKYYYRPRVSSFIEYIKDIFNNLEAKDYSKMDDALTEIYKEIEIKWVNEGYDLVETNYDADDYKLLRAIKNAFSLISTRKEILSGFEKLSIKDINQKTDVFSNSNNQQTI